MSDIKEKYTSEGDYTIIDSSSIIGPYPDYNVGIGSSAGINGTYGLGTGNSVLTSNATGNAMWTASPYTIGTTGYGAISSGNGTTQPTIKVSGDAEFEGRVMINKRDLGEFIEAMSKRLAILVPDPEKLEHFEALKKAYDHYKLMEALCELPKETKE
jgi:hypothetical protein